MACDHIIGFELCAYPQHGERDRLMRESEMRGEFLDQPFAYCPECGADIASLILANDDQLHEIAGRAFDLDCGFPKLVAYLHE